VVADVNPRVDDVNAAAGVIGGLPVLMGIILASNLGAFLLYALLCILTIQYRANHSDRSLKLGNPKHLAVF